MVNLRKNFNFELHFFMLLLKASSVHRSCLLPICDELSLACMPTSNYLDYIYYAKNSSYKVFHSNSDTLLLWYKCFDISAFHLSPIH